MKNYVLGHTSNEMGRLDSQASLLEDPLLFQLAGAAEKILEMGAGVGSNWPFINNANPTSKYLGIDFSSSATERAQKTYGESRAQFQTMDATNLHLSDESFDLVFSKLVLWSIGRCWKTAVKEAYRVLKPGGVFYAFEPFDQAVLFSPPKPKMSALIETWDHEAAQAGMDPLIGPKVPAAFLKAGFTNVQTKAFPVLAHGNNPEKYSAIIQNLKQFYDGDFVGNPSKKMNEDFKTEALDELTASSPLGLVMDFFFVTWGRK